MKWPILALLLPLSGCDSAAESAERDYEFAKQSAGIQEMCDAAIRVKREWQARRDDRKFREWEGRASHDCLLANLRR